MTCDPCAKNFRPSKGLKELLKHKWLRLNGNLIALNPMRSAANVPGSKKKDAVFWPTLNFHYQVSCSLFHNLLTRI
jgi:hypothetical protein